MPCSSAHYLYHTQNMDFAQYEHLHSVANQVSGTILKPNLNMLLSNKFRNHCSKVSELRYTFPAFEIVHRLFVLIKRSVRNH